MLTPVKFSPFPRELVSFSDRSRAAPAEDPLNLNRQFELLCSRKHIRKMKLKSKLSETVSLKQQQAEKPKSTSKESLDEMTANYQWLKDSTHYVEENKVTQKSAEQIPFITNKIDYDLCHLSANQGIAALASTVELLRSRRR